MVDQTGRIRSVGPLTGQSGMKLSDGWRPKISVKSIPGRSLIKGPLLLELSPSLLRVIPPGEERIGTKSFWSAKSQNVYRILGRISSLEGPIESLLADLEQRSGILAIKFLAPDNWQIASLATHKTDMKDQVLFITDGFKPAASEILPILGTFESESVLAEFERFNISALGGD